VTPKLTIVAIIIII